MYIKLNNTLTYKYIHTCLIKTYRENKIEEKKKNQIKNINDLEKLSTKQQKQLGI